MYLLKDPTKRLAGGARLVPLILVGLMSVTGVLVLPTLVTPTGEVEAIPAFARKYQTSCQTCHVAFPTLTPFGEAYRRNSYRWPAGEEEDTSWDEPVALGQPAHRRVFPDAVWPGQSPGTLPITAIIGMNSTFLDEDGDAELRLLGVGSSVGITVAGAIDSTFSAWAGIRLVAGRSTEEAGETIEPELERVFMTMSIFEDPILNFRLGRIEPSLLGFSMHRTLGPAPWIVTTPMGDNGFTLEPAQIGLEMHGVVADGRLSYAAGVVEGSGNRLEPPQDVYGRLAYKLGGMRWDGIGGSPTSVPWRDNALSIGAFGYLGSAELGDPTLATQTDQFYVVGGDVQLNYWNLDVKLAYSFSSNERAILAAPDDHMSAHQVYTQVDWVAFPWLVPSARFELRRIEHGDTEMRVTPAVYALIRANIRAQVIAQLNMTSGHVDLSQIIAGVNTAF